MAISMTGDELESEAPSAAAGSATAVTVVPAALRAEVAASAEPKLAESPARGLQSTWRDNNQSGGEYWQVT